MVYIANWPEARQHHWDTLLQARAIENLSYVVGVNRTGTDGKGIAYGGGSVVVGPRGERLFWAGNQETTQTVELDWQALQAYRAAFPAHLDADSFRLDC